MNLFSWERFFNVIPIITPYLSVTFLVVIIATIFGSILGILVAIVQIRKIPVISQICILYISFMRGTPMLVQLFLILYGLPIILQPVLGVNIGREWDRIDFAYATFILNQGAFLSVIFRSAIESVPVGQVEAGMSVGLTVFQNFRRVIFPQALKVALPPFGTDLIGLFENSSLVFTIGVIDIMGRAKTIGSSSGHVLEACIYIAIIYILISITVRVLFQKGTKKYGN